MSQAPYLLPRARDGARMGNSPMLDTMIHDGLWCAFNDRHMGEGTDEMNRESASRARTQDAWAARSHARAAAGVGGGPVRRGGRPGRVPAAQGRPGGRARDEGDPRRHDRGAAGGAQAGVPRGRDRHRRQRVADQRRRLRGGRGRERRTPCGGSGWRRWRGSRPTAWPPTASPRCTRCRRSRWRRR